MFLGAMLKSREQGLVVVSWRYGDGWLCRFTWEGEEVKVNDFDLGGVIKRGKLYILEGDGPGVVIWAFGVIRVSLV